MKTSPGRATPTTIQRCRLLTKAAAFTEDRVNAVTISRKTLDATALDEENLQCTCIMPLTVNHTTTIVSRRHSSAASRFYTTILNSNCGKNVTVTIRTMR